MRRGLVLAVSITVALLAGGTAAQAKPADDIDLLIDRTGLTRPVSSTDAPAQLGAGFSVTTPAGVLTLTPVGAVNVSRVMTPAGRAAYDGAHASTTTVFQREHDKAASVLNIVRGPDAPTEHSWDVSTAGRSTRLVARPDGGVDIVATTGGAPDGTTVARIAPPWAIDANDRDVHTSYKVNGARLTQVIYHGARGVSYPVVADPRWAWG